MLRLQKSTYRWWQKPLALVAGRPLPAELAVLLAELGPGEAGAWLNSRGTTSGVVDLVSTGSEKFRTVRAKLPRFVSCELAAIYEATGLSKGAPDLVLWSLHDEQLRFVEVKCPHWDRPSKEQLKFLRAAKERGNPVSIEEWEFVGADPSTVEVSGASKLLDSAPRLSPGDLVVADVPAAVGIYAWYEVRGAELAYIGKATGKRGLRYRIMRQHLNPEYLESRREHWTEEDEPQARHGITRRGRLVVEKSAFRKNLARKYGLVPGDETVQYIKERFTLSFLSLLDLSDREIRAFESHLIALHRPKLNRSGLKQGR